MIEKNTWLVLIYVTMLIAMVLLFVDVSNRDPNLFASRKGSCSLSS